MPLSGHSEGTNPEAYSSHATRQGTFGHLKIDRLWLEHSPKLLASEYKATIAVRAQRALGAA